MYLDLPSDVAKFVRDIASFNSGKKVKKGISIKMFLDALAFASGLFKKRNNTDNTETNITGTVSAQLTTNIKSGFQKSFASLVRPAKISLSLLEMHSVHKGKYQYPMTFMSSYLSGGKTMTELHAQTDRRTRPRKPEPCAEPPSSGFMSWTAEHKAFRKANEPQFKAWDDYQSSVGRYNAAVDIYRESRFHRAFEKDIW